MTATPEPVDTCRPVTVQVDGEPTTVRVRAAEDMSDDGRAALANIIAAAKRRFEAEAPNRCGDAAALGCCDHEHVCTKQPHDDDNWHADGSGVRWRWDRVMTIRHGRSAREDSCRSCGRDFALPYVTRQQGTDSCEDCVTVSWNRDGAAREERCGQ